MITIVPFDAKNAKPGVDLFSGWVNVTLPLGESKEVTPGRLLTSVAYATLSPTL